MAYFKAHDPSLLITPSDDYMIHQVPAPVRHVGTSDRNFCERCYFTGMGWQDGMYLSSGFGQYPNLGVQDGWFGLADGERQRVVRVSRELDDRMDTSVGPLRIEMVEPLRKLRLILEENESGIQADLLFDASAPAFVEPHHVVRRHGRTIVETERFSQIGHWIGTIEFRGTRFELSPDNWTGYRDHSWGIRPVGEPEPSGIQGVAPPGSSTMRLEGMWTYCCVQFPDHEILIQVHETNDGRRHVDEAARIWKDPDRPLEALGSAEIEHHFVPGTRRVRSTEVKFPQAPGGPFTMLAEPVQHFYLNRGTGYGSSSTDWRNGHYRGPSWIDTYDESFDRLDKEAHFEVTDYVARYELDDGTNGIGMHETHFRGPFEKCGFFTDDDVAP